MARYIDADALTEELKLLSIYITGMPCGKIYLHTVVEEYKKTFLKLIEEQPTADVAPREDFANEKAMGDMCAEVIARQDKEIERLQNEANRYRRYYFRHDYDEMIAEVLDKLDRFIDSNCIEIKDERGIKGYVTSGVHFAIAELKKKYSEGKNV